MGQGESHQMLQLWSYYCFMFRSVFLTSDISNTLLIVQNMLAESYIKNEISVLNAPPTIKGQKTPLLVMFIISLTCIDYGKPRVVVATAHR